jgi:tubulin-folding cofactor B
MSTPHAFGAVADIPLLIKSVNAQSERRVNPAWTIAHFKSRLEPITGIPSSTQKLSFRIASQDAVSIEAANEEQVQLSSFGLQPYAEITVSSNRLLTYFISSYQASSQTPGYPTVWRS